MNQLPVWARSSNNLHALQWLFSHTWSESQFKKESNDEIAITGYVAAHGSVKKRMTMLLLDDKKNFTWRERNVDSQVNKFSYELEYNWFLIVTLENGYIQILLTSSIHWICVSNMTSGKFPKCVFLIAYFCQKYSKM